jgi:hypothetical protein
MKVEQEPLGFPHRETTKCTTLYWVSKKKRRGGGQKRKPADIKKINFFVNHGIYIVIYI